VHQKLWAGGRARACTPPRTRAAVLDDHVAAADDGGRAGEASGVEELPLLVAGAPHACLVAVHVAGGVHGPGRKGAARQAGCESAQRGGRARPPRVPAGPGLSRLVYLPRPAWLAGTSCSAAPGCSAAPLAAAQRLPLGATHLQIIAWSVPSAIRYGVLTGSGGPAAGGGASGGAAVTPGWGSVGGKGERLHQGHAGQCCGQACEWRPLQRRPGRSPATAAGALGRR
jgi:hypothetical protein